MAIVRPLFDKSRCTRRGGERSASHVAETFFAPTLPAMQMNIKSSVFLTRSHINIIKSRHAPPVRQAHASTEKGGSIGRQSLRNSVSRDAAKRIVPTESNHMGTKNGSLSRIFHSAFRKIYPAFRKFYPAFSFFCSVPGFPPFGKGSFPPIWRNFGDTLLLRPISAERASPGTWGWQDSCAKRPKKSVSSRLSFEFCWPFRCFRVFLQETCLSLNLNALRSHDNGSRSARS